MEQKTNILSLEGQVELARSGLRPKSQRRSRSDKLGSQYADALAELEKAETKLSRALNRWNKARAKLRRLELALRRVESDPT